MSSFFTLVLLKWAAVKNSSGSWGNSSWNFRLPSWRLLLNLTLRIKMRFLIEWEEREVCGACWYNHCHFSASHWFTENSKIYPIWREVSDLRSKVLKLKGAVNMKNKFVSFYVLGKHGRALYDNYEPCGCGHICCVAKQVVFAFTLFLSTNQGGRSCNWHMVQYHLLIDTVLPEGKQNSSIPYPKT